MFDFEKVWLEGTTSFFEARCRHHGLEFVFKSVARPRMAFERILRKSIQLRLLIEIRKAKMPSSMRDAFYRMLAGTYQNKNLTAPHDVDRSPFRIVGGGIERLPVRN